MQRTGAHASSLHVAASRSLQLNHAHAPGADGTRRGDGAGTGPINASRRRSTAPSATPESAAEASSGSPIPSGAVTSPTPRADAVATSQIIPRGRPTTRYASDRHGQYAVNLVMEGIDEFVMIPVPLVAIVTGVLLSMGTLWGFFQWYWLLVKQVATYVLLLLAPFTLHEWIVQMTNLSRAGVVDASNAGVQRLHLLASVMTIATGAAIMTISVLKPWGRFSRCSGGPARHRRR
jgi:hypothetical protein